MIILGIDPGVATVGIGLVEKEEKTRQVRSIDWLTITTKAGSDFPRRLEEIALDLGKIIDECKPELAVVEKLFFATNKRTALDVAQARGAILLTLAQHDIPILEATPLQLKTAIAGDGKADKRQMQDMVMRTLKLDERPTPDDAADALALALYGAFTGKLIIEN